MKLDFLHPHRNWLMLFGAGVVLMAAGLPLISLGLDWETHKAEAIAQERAELQKSARRFEEDMQLAQKTGGQLSDEDIERLRAPADRLRVVAELERQASAHRLSHFTYALSPEKKAKVDVIDAADMVTSDLTIAGDMPLDTDAFAFVQSIGYILPGRVRVRQFSLSRVASDAQLSLDNLHMDAVLEWLSNGAAKAKGGNP